MEVEAIGHVRHKNLVRLLGYCIEGTQRYHVYLLPMIWQVEQAACGLVSLYES